MKSKQVVGGAIVDDLLRPTRLLVARRSAPESLRGLWEFPGGKVEIAELPEAALHRELAEELGVQVKLGHEVTGSDADGWLLGNGARMRVWFVQITSGEPSPLEDHDQLQWMPLSEESALMALPWIPADFPIVAELLRSVYGRSA